MTVTLTGFMGCGKSSVGKALAERLGWEFIDLDAYIVHKKGMSIPEIFSEEGEEAFRAVEAECVRDVIVMHQITGRNTILALGGGTLTITSVRWLIIGQTECFYLKSSLEACLERIGDTSSRPLLSSSADIRTLFLERESGYALASHIIDTEGKSCKDVAEEILSSLR